MKTRTLVISASIGAIVLIALFAIFSLQRAEQPREGMAAAPPPPVGSVRPPPVASAPPFPMATAPPPSDPIATVDRILEKLEFGNIAFNAPRAINIDDTAIIHLLLGLGTPADELKEMIEAAGDKEGASIRVSNRMEARLSGPNFAITAITPEVQAVTRTAVTEWKWEVQPSRQGRQRLHLTLSVTHEHRWDIHPKGNSNFR